MTMSVYAVYDVKTGVFFAPMVYHNDAHAIRELRRPFKDASSSLGQYPEDYDVYLVGSWSDHEGKLEGLTPPRLVVKGTALAPDGAVSTVPFPKVG